MKVKRKERGKEGNKEVRKGRNEGRKGAGS